ncbi:MAG TPA: flagellar assembly protein FliX [Rhizomicrobium sp.]|jgi:hypothetical protein
MEIKSTGSVGSSGVRRAGKPAAGGDSAFKVATTETPHAQVIGGVATIGAVENILMLQELDDSTSGPSKGVARGQQLLDLLDAVRDGLLAGGIPRSTLNRLASAVTRRHESFADPKLQGVLDEIELRAHVELAKLEMIDKRVA